MKARKKEPEKKPETLVKKLLQMRILLSTIVVLILMGITSVIFELSLTKPVWISNPVVTAFSGISYGFGILAGGLLK